MRPVSRSVCHSVLSALALLSAPVAAAVAMPADVDGQVAAVRLSPDVVRRLDETGAPVKVWAFLADKGFADEASRTAALEEAHASLSPRALQRRALRRTAPGLVDQRDLPVAPVYLQALGEVGEVNVASRWLNAVSLTIPPATLPDLLALPFVTRVQLVGRSVPRQAPVDGLPLGLVQGSAQGQDEIGSSSARGKDASLHGAAAPLPVAQGGTSFYGHAEAQSVLIDVPELHGLGLDGSGAVVGVLDTGFVTTHDAFQQPGHEVDVIASYDFVNDDGDVGIEAGDASNQHEHGTLILGTLAGYLPDTFVGVAHEASFILCKTEDVSQEVEAEEDFYVAGLEFAETNGADLVTSSLGYIDWYTQADLDGLTAVTTLAVNVATANGLHCLTSAGNSGHDTDPLTSALIAPSDAFDVITCGASEFTGEISSFSSDGPTADGRTKPEVLAMGTDTITVYPYDDVSYVFASGTSLSTPLVAGVAACMVGAHPEWSVATLRERLMRTAGYFGEPLPDPLHRYGHGVIDADDAATLAGSWADVGAGLAGGAGVPALVGGGTLVGDEPVTLDLTGGPAFGTSFLVLGLSAVNAPFKGGTLVPSPDIVVAGLPLDASGDLSLSFPWVPGAPSGATAWFQHWIPDGGAVAGFAASNAVSGTTP